MDSDMLIKGYRKVLKKIYSPNHYYERLLRFLKEYNPPLKMPKLEGLTQMKSLLRTIFILGIFDRGRKYYWKIFFWAAFRKPKLFPRAIYLMAWGYHFRKVFRV